MEVGKYFFCIRSSRLVRFVLDRLIFTFEATDIKLFATNTNR